MCDFELAPTRSPTSASLSAAAVLADLPNTPAETTINGILTRRLRE